MTTLLRDVLVVAAYELSSALRSRLLQLVLAGYAAAMFLGDWAFVETLQVAETQVAAQLGLPGTERPGTLLAHVTESAVVRDVLAEAVGSDVGLSRLLEWPLLGLWCGVVSMAALPVVLLAGSAGSLAQEVQSRSARYLVLRTERLAIVLGKLGGQAVLGFAAAALGALVTVVVSQVLMVAQDPLGIGVAALAFSLRGLAYALPLGALGLAVSQWVPSLNGARAVALLAWIACAVAGAWIEHAGPGGMAGRCLDLVAWFLPTTGWGDLWSADASVLGLALAHAVIVSLAWLALGLLRFSGRDL